MVQLHCMNMFAQTRTVPSYWSFAPEVRDLRHLFLVLLPMSVLHFSPTKYLSSRLDLNGRRKDSCTIERADDEMCCRDALLSYAFGIRSFMVNRRSYMWWQSLTELCYGHSTFRRDDVNIYRIIYIYILQILHKMNPVNNE